MTINLNTCKIWRNSVFITIMASFQMDDNERFFTIRYLFQFIQNLSIIASRPAGKINLLRNTRCKLKCYIPRSWRLVTDKVCRISNLICYIR